MRVSRSFAALLIGLSVASVADAQTWSGSAAIEVRVADDSGKPLADAQVVFRLPDSADGDGPEPVMTDASGQATLSGLREGEWFVEISRQGYMLYAAYVNLTAGKKPSIGFSSQVNTADSWEPMRVKFVKAGSPLSKKEREQIAESRPPDRGAPPAPRTDRVPTVVRTEPEETEATSEPTATAQAPTAEAAPTPEPKAERVPVVVRTEPQPTPPVPARDDQPEPVPAPEVISPEAPADPQPTEIPAPEAASPTPTTLEEPAEETPRPTEPPPGNEARPATAPEPQDTTAPSAPSAGPASAPPAVETPPAAPPVAPLTAEPEMPEPEAPAPEVRSTTPTAEVAPETDRQQQAQPKQPAQPPSAEVPMVEPDLAEPGPMEPETAPETPTLPDAGETVPEPEAQPAEPASPALDEAEAPAEAAPRAEPEMKETAPPPPAVSRPRQPPVAVPTAPPQEVPARIRVPPYLRSATIGTCEECQRTEWAVTTEQLAEKADDPIGGDDCPGTLGPEARQGIQLLLNEGASELVHYAGPLMTAVWQLEDRDLRGRVRSLLATATNSRTSCQLAGVVLPGGSRFTGYSLEAWDALGGGNCAVDRDCAVGAASWMAEPRVGSVDGATVVWAFFKNRSTRRDRRARFVVYFEPPSGWLPPQ